MICPRCSQPWDSCSCPKIKATLGDPVDLVGYVLVGGLAYGLYRLIKLKTEPKRGY